MRTGILLLVLIISGCTMPKNVEDGFKTLGDGLDKLEDQAIKGHDAPSEDLDFAFWVQLELLREKELLKRSIAKDGNLTIEDVNAVNQMIVAKKLEIDEKRKNHKRIREVLIHNFGILRRIHLKLESFFGSVMSESELNSDLKDLYNNIKTIEKDE